MVKLRGKLSPSPDFGYQFRHLIASPTTTHSAFNFFSPENAEMDPVKSLPSASLTVKTVGVCVVTAHIFVGAYTWETKLSIERAR